MATLARVAKFGAPRVPEAIGSAFVVKRGKATDVNLTNYKRGTGGRSSFSGIVATVFGGKSVLGHLVINRLGKIGSQVIIPYRGDPINMQGMKMYGDLGQILFQPLDIRDDSAVRDACRYSNVVINLIGKEYETRNFSFNEVHVEGAARIARIAKECGVERLIHVSALMAGTKTSNVSKNGSAWLMSKGEGEEAVRSEFPDAIIMRPSVFVDNNDYYLTQIFEPWRIYKNRLPRGQASREWLFPMWDGEIIKQPVLPRNVASGIVAAIRDPNAPGKTYQCTGPHAYNAIDLIDYTYRCAEKLNVEYSSYLGNVVTRAQMREFIYRTIGFPKPKVTLDRLERDSVSDVLDPSLPTLADLGITTENVEEAIYWLHRDRAKSNQSVSMFERKITKRPSPPQTVLV